MGQPLSPNTVRSLLSFGEIPWFDVAGNTALGLVEWCVSDCAEYEFPGYGFFQANHSAVFPPVHRTMGIRWTTVWAI